MSLPRKLVDFNVYHASDGSWLGKANEINLAKLARKMEDFNTGVGIVEIDMGMDKMEVGVTFDEFVSQILREFGARHHDAVGLRFAGFVRSSVSGVDSASVEMVVRGRWREHELGTAKRGDNHQPKSTLTLSYFKWSENGQPLFECDVVNRIEKSGDTDLLEEQRNAIGL